MLTLPHPLQSARLARPDHLLLLCDSAQWSARRLAILAAEVAGVLEAQGLRAGGTLVLDGPMNARWLQAFYAAGWCGASVAPLPPHLSEAARNKALGALPEDALVVQTAASTVIAGLLPRVSFDVDNLNCAALPERGWPMDEIRLRVLTSGTTGTPRWISLNTQQVFFNAMGAALRLGHMPFDRWLLCLPVHHVGGLMVLMRALFCGTQVQVMARFVASAVADALDQGTVHLTALVPAMLEQVLACREPTPLPRALRAVLLGGAAATQALLQTCEALGVPVATCWGMTETASHVTASYPNTYGAPFDCGPPLAFARVHADGPTLTVSGLMVPTPLVTTDLGVVDEAGHVRVTGRSDDTLISGGENIAPSEIELTLCSHPAVQNAAVVGLDSQRWGQRPWAAVVLRPGVCVSVSGLRDFCASHLPRYKIPDGFMVCKALPHDALGKLQRGAVAGLFGRVVIDTHAVQTEFLQPPDEGLGHGHGASQAGVAAAHKGVHETYLSQGLAGAPRLPVDARDGVPQGDGALAYALDVEGNLEIVAHARRLQPIGIGVHQRRHPIAAAEAVFEGAEHLHEQFLPGGVAELKKSREKHDARAVDVKKTNGQPVTKNHG